MVAFSSILIALSSATAALASPLNLILNAEKRDESGALISRSTPSGTGTHNGFFYSFWTDGQGQVNYNNGAGGSVRQQSPLSVYSTTILIPHSTMSRGRT